MEELKNKIQKEELYELLQKNKNYNIEEGDYLKKKLEQVDPKFEKRIQRSRGEGEGEGEEEEVEEEIED